MTKAYIVLFFAFLVQSNCFAQISPPGMGKANTAAWMAIGIKQNINQKETLESTTFVGLGTISDPNNLNIFEKKSIYVINEEITYRFKPHWNYSLAASYRWQNKYRSNKPYYLDSPYARQEIRVYSRFTYENKFKNINYTLTYRPEIRFFFQPNFDVAEETKQLRSRFRAKIAFNLNNLKTKKISVATEMFFGVSTSNKWETFKYKETRVCLYYSYKIPKVKTTFNMGYMNALLGKKISKSVNYLAFDVVFKNLL